MAQSGWRLPPELLKRVRVRCAETGERQNAFVERALESALGLPSQGDAPGSGGESRGSGVSTPAQTRTSVKPSPRLPAGVKTAREIASERQAALNKAKGS